MAQLNIILPESDKQRVAVQAERQLAMQRGMSIWARAVIMKEVERLERQQAKRGY